MNTADFLLAAGNDTDLAIGEARREYSYADLRSVVAVIARRLIDLDLSPGDAVALAAPNGLFWAAAYLAALNRGLVVTPMPVTLTPAEIVGRVEWLGCRAVLLGRSQVRTLSGLLPSPLHVLDESTVAENEELTLPAAVDVSGDADALYEFTSGTTGRPRVVRITHRNIQANTESILNFLNLARDDRMLVVLPFSYVFGASLLHTHLRAGAAMILQPNFVFPESIVERMISERCTGFAGVPSTFHLLLRNSSFRSRRVATLRSIQQAGGKLPPVLIRELVEAQPQAQLFVMYGQTEATARLSYLSPEEVLSRIGSVGRGIPGVELSVIGRDGEPVAPGTVGEIRARGQNISPGYLNDPVATAAKMGGGELRTGDLATVDQDGYIYVVDRAEDFIKSWGHRIAGQDVEAVVMQLPDVVAAAVVGVPDEAAGERVELALVKRRGAILDTETVLAHCRAQLAKHMVPATVHLVEQLPLNANGKVSKRDVRAYCVRVAGEQSA